MELLLIAGALLLFGGNSGSSGGGYNAAKQPSPSGTSPTRPGANDWGTQLGALLNGLGGGISKVVDAAQDDSK
jgi:hypothetical protein